MSVLVSAALAANLLFMQAPLYSGGGSAESMLLSGFISVAPSVLVSKGSIDAFLASGELVVSSVEVVGDSTKVVITRASDGVSATFVLSAEASARVATFLGRPVKVIKEPTGHALISDDKLLVYVPNEVGRPLLHHDKVAR